MRAWPLNLPDDEDVRRVFKGITVDNMGHVVVACHPSDADAATVLRHIFVGDFGTSLLNMPFVLGTGMVALEVHRPKKHPIDPDLAKWLVDAGKKIVQNTVADQPPPTATNRRAAWDIVLEFTERRRRDNAYGLDGTLDLVLADMRERDRLGKERYGVRLTSGNGRNHLVDAYQEALDKIVYLANELDEHGLSPEDYPDAAKYDKDLQRHLLCVQQMLWDDVRSALRLRAMIEARSK